MKRDLRQESIDKWKGIVSVLASGKLPDKYGCWEDYRAEVVNSLCGFCKRTGQIINNENDYDCSKCVLKESGIACGGFGGSYFSRVNSLVGKQKIGEALKYATKMLEVISDPKYIPFFEDKGKGMNPKQEQITDLKHAVSEIVDDGLIEKMDAVYWLFDINNSSRGTGRTSVLAAVFLFLAVDNPNTKIYFTDHWITMGAKDHLLDKIKLFWENIDKPDNVKLTLNRDYIVFELL